MRDTCSVALSETDVPLDSVHLYKKGETGS